MLDSIYEKTNVVIRRIVILPGRAAVGPRRASRRASRRCAPATPTSAERLKRMNLQKRQETLRRFQKYVL